MSMPRGSIVLGSLLALGLASTAARRGEAQSPPLFRPAPAAREVGLGGSELFVAPHLTLGRGRFQLATEGVVGRGASEFVEGRGTLTLGLTSAAALEMTFASTKRGLEGENAVDREGILGLRGSRIGAWLGMERGHASTPAFRIGTEALDLRAWADLGVGIGLTYRRARVEETGEVLRDTTHVILGEYEFRTRRLSRFFRAGEYSEVEIDLTAGLGPLFMALHGGHRLETAEGDGVSWAFARVALPLSAGVEIVSELGTNAGLPSLGRGPTRFGRLGLRVDLAALVRGPAEDPGAFRPDRWAAGRDAPIPRDLPRADLLVETEGSRLVIVSPGSERVEVKGDFTDWETQPLASMGAGRWSVPIEPGVHRLNIRIDEGGWTVPANLPSVPDEFSGAPVAVIVVR